MAQTPDLIGPIQDLKQSAEKLKVILTPEVEQFVREHLEAAQEKMAKKGELTQKDLQFIEEAKGMMQAEYFRQIELPVQYGRCLDTLRFYNLLYKNSSPPPDLSTTQNSFTLEQLRIAQGFEEPTLLIAPKFSLPYLVQALDTHKLAPQKKDTLVDGLFPETNLVSEMKGGWDVAIVDGAKEMGLKKKDDLSREFLERIAYRLIARKSVESGMDRTLYAMLMMESLRRGKPIDQQTYTLLDGDSVNFDVRVPAASFVDGQVVFNWYLPFREHTTARFRSVVRGNLDRSIIDPRK